VIHQCFHRVHTLFAIHSCRKFLSCTSPIFHFYRSATITAEVPNGSIHRFNGFLGIPDGSHPVSHNNANHGHGGMGSSTTRLSHSSGGSLSTVSPAGSKSGGGCAEYFYCHLSSVKCFALCVGVFNVFIPREFCAIKLALTLHLVFSFISQVPPPLPLPLIPCLWLARSSAPLPRKTFCCAARSCALPSGPFAPSCTPARIPNCR